METPKQRIERLEQALTKALGCLLGHEGAIKGVATVITSDEETKWPFDPETHVVVPKGLLKRALYHHVGNAPNADSMAKASRKELLTASESGE